MLFYVGWEIMMIPLYILMGVWGGERRRAATLQFVVYTLVGSLLMLVAIAVLGVSAHTFDVQTLVAAAARVDLAVPGVRRRVLHQGAALPAARLAAGRLPRVDPRGDGAALGRDLQGRGVRPAALRHPALSDRRPRLALALSGPRPHRAPVRRDRRVPPAGRPRGRRLLEPQPDEPDRDRDLRLQPERRHRRDPADGEPRHRLAGRVPADRPRGAARRHRRLPRSSAASPTSGR